MTRTVSRPCDRTIAWSFFCLAALCALLIWLSPTTYARAVTDEKDESTVFAGTTMGPIEYEVTVANLPDGIEPYELDTQVAAALERVNGLMSTYIEDSDVSRFNRSESTDWIEVNSETAIVVQRAIAISRLTDGAFDITVAPAVRIWNFGSGADHSADEIPGNERIQSALDRIGYEKLEVRTNPPAIRKSVANVEIDLSAIAKGYAVDAVVEVLRSADCENFLVSIGGEVYADGITKAGTAWKIGIERPVLNRREVQGVVELNRTAMATSGDYRSLHFADGKFWSHTIDPGTACPVEHATASASVVAADCMTADALATAIMVAGPAKGLEFALKAEVEAMVMTRVAADPRIESGFESVSTPGFEFEQAPEETVASSGILPVFLSALVIFSLAILGMAVGSIVANKPVKGSCGGLAAMTGEDGESSCSLCSKPVTDCVERELDPADAP